MMSKFQKFAMLAVMLCFYSFQSAHAVTVTINGQTVNSDDVQNFANQIESGQINPNSISEEEFNQLSPSQQQQIVDAYNERNNSNLSTSQFQTEVRNQANNTSNNDVNNATNQVLNENPSVRDALNDPANADTTQLQQDANLTDAQIREIQAAQEELRRQEAQTAARAAELQAQQNTINETQNTINTLNDSVSNLDNQSSGVQSNLDETNARIEELERRAAEANASGDIDAFNETQDALEAARREEIAQKDELKRIQQDKARKEQEISNQETILAEQQRQQQIKQAELDASKNAEEELKSDIAQTVVDSVSGQSVTNFVGEGEEGAGENSDAPTVGEVLGVIQEEQENGNITVDENGNIQIDQEAIVENQNQENPQGYCTDAGVCISNERAVEGLVCKTKPEDEQQACMQEVSRGATKDYIEGGKGCMSNNTPDATACREAGRTYNCEFGQCLSEDQVNELADRGADCMTKPTKDEQNACFKDVKMAAIENGARGNYCLKDSAEAQSCEASGKHWNCNINTCVDDSQNDAIAGAVVECQTKETNAEKNRCMDELKENGAYLLASACEEAQSPKGLQCSEGGNVWNCGANACVTPDMNGRLVEAFKRCQNKGSQEAVDKCMSELDEIAAAASDNKELTAEDFESPGSPASVGYAVVGAIGSLVATVAGGGICMGAVVNAAAGVMAIMNEKNSAKMADQQLGQLKERFQDLEKRMEDDVISFEIQKEAIDFYINALETSIRIAENYADGYDQSGNMFGIATAIAAVEIIIYAPKPPWPGEPHKVYCAIAATASAAMGMMLSSKASGIARGMADEFRDQKAKLIRIRDLYNKHFGQSGGMTTLASYKGGGRGIRAGDGNVNVNRATAQSAPGAESRDAGEEQKNGAVCDTNIVSPLQKCHCENQADQCLSLGGSPLLETKIGRDLAAKLEIEKSFNETNSIARGDITASDIGSGSLATRFRRTRKTVKSLLDQVNKKRKKAGINDPLVFPTNADLAAFVNKAMPPESRIGGSNKFLGKVMGDVNPGDIKATERALSSNIGKDGKVQMNATVSTPLGKLKKPNLKGLDELDAEELDTLAKIKDKGVVNSTLSDKDLLEIDDVHENTTKSLWNILTKRYHVITRQKRIGKWKKRGTSVR